MGTRFACFGSWGFLGIMWPPCLFIVYRWNWLQCTLRWPQQRASPVALKENVFLFFFRTSSMVIPGHFAAAQRDPWGRLTSTKPWPPVESQSYTCNEYGNIYSFIRSFFNPSPLWCCQSGNTNVCVFCGYWPKVRHSTTDRCLFCWQMTRNKYRLTSQSVNDGCWFCWWLREIPTASVVHSILKK